MTLDNSSATGDGVAIASADICPNASFNPGEPTGCFTSESLITFAADGFSGLTDSKSFGTATFFDVFTDLTVDGGPSGSASLGSATFAVTVTPEPATGWLLLAGCGALLLKRFLRPV